MLETPRRGSIEITSLQRVESVALQSDAPQIPKAPRDARWRDAFVLAMVTGVARDDGDDAGRAYAPLNYHLDPPPSPSVSEARLDSTARFDN